jgi:hypothetical protein
MLGYIFRYRILSLLDLSSHFIVICGPRQYPAHRVFAII